MALAAGALADACALLAFFSPFGSTMTQAGVSAMQGNVAVSSITVWELTRKATLGRLPALPMLRGSFGGYLADQGFQMLVLSWEDAEQANALPPIHKDPMDRMLIAQALTRGMPIITEDGLFPRYGVRTVW